MAPFFFLRDAPFLRKEEPGVRMKVRTYVFAFSYKRGDEASAEKPPKMIFPMASFLFY